METALLLHNVHNCTRLRHVFRMYNDLPKAPAKTGLTWTPKGKRCSPKTIWRQTMEELKAAGLTMDIDRSHTICRILISDPNSYFFAK